MTIRVRRPPNGRGERVVTDTCSACGAVREWHYRYFSEHLLNDHSPEDFGLPSPQEREGDGD